MSGNLHPKQSSEFDQAAEHQADAPLNRFRNPGLWPMSDQPEDFGGENLRGVNQPAVGNVMPEVLNVSAEDIGLVPVQRDPLRSHGAAHRITRKLVFPGNIYTDGHRGAVQPLTDYVRQPEGTDYQALGRSHPDALRTLRGRAAWAEYVGVDTPPDETGVTTSRGYVGDLGLPDEAIVRLPGGEGGNRKTVG